MLEHLYFAGANIYVMKRTTVYLEEDLNLELKRLADQQGRPQAELIREALRNYAQANRSSRAVPEWVGLGQSGVGNLSERVDELLFSDRKLPGRKK
jgi:predicted transcriptional regulator